MFSYCRAIVEKAEAEAKGSGDPAAVLAILRGMPLDDFGEFLMLSPHAEFPALGTLLPPMASAEAQQQWTGSDGYTLLRQSLSFMRSVSQVYAELRCRSLADARILDWGCGYGRLLRLMYYYSDPARVFACDPWDMALDLCRADRLLGTIAQSDYLPTRVPFDGEFDFIYAFSVFTHLSRNATLASLNVLSKALAPKGLLVVTTRPIEYWDYDLRPGPERLESLKADHVRDGFAYTPHGNIVSEGEAVYGDTSMELTFLTDHAPELRIARMTRSIDDPYQLLVFLEKK